MDKKVLLRLYAKDVRKELDTAALSEKLTEKIRQHKAYAGVKNVMIYYPMKDEIDLRGLLKDDKSFFLPKVNGKELIICPYCTGDKLEKSCFNTEEPCTAPVDGKIIDLIIVPALAVDKQNYRLGYGGGFYDRLLEKFPNTPTLSAVAKKLVLFEIPTDKHDKKIKYIITE